MAVTTILSPGAKVGGKYEVVEVLGFGGMGVVYKVREQVGAVSRIRALKTVLPQYASDKAVATRFRQEAEKMCMLEHENIVPVLSYSEEGEFPYLVMPFIEGQTLKDYLASCCAEHGHGLPLSEVMEIGLELVRGLEVAHRFVNPETRRPQPMVHRDIKPGNIMVRVENQSGERRLKVLIMDFGIAKVLSDQDSGHSLTEVIGTVKYASPEQIRRGKDIDPRADIYSLGMVLYELQAGRHMFAGHSEHSVLMRMVQRDIEDFAISFPEGTPERFRQLIERSVAVDRERRFSTVAEMRTAMRRILEEDSERVATEAEHARELARSERARALERGAAEFASRPLHEGDELLAQGEAAIAEHRLKHAIPSLRAAAEVFARAAEESAEGRERARLERGATALAELRAAAMAVDAERLAPTEVAAAAEAMRVFAKVLEAGDLTGGARALALAERAWHEAQTHAEQQRLRLEAVAACDRLDAAIAASRAELERLPSDLRHDAGGSDLGLAEAAATAARRAAAAGDFAAASASAAEGLAVSERAEARRKEVLARFAGEVSDRVAARLRALDASPDVGLVADRHAEVRAGAEAGTRLAADGRYLDAVAAFEGTLAAVTKLESEIAARAAERERALHAAERNRRAETAARDARESLVGARSALTTLERANAAEAVELDGASQEARAGEDAFGRSEYAEALPMLRSAAGRLETLAAAMARRQEHERLQARLEELRAEATERTKALGALGTEACNTPQARRLLASLASAEEQGANGDLGAAIRVLETSLPELDRTITLLETEIERARLKSQAEAERQRAEDTQSRARSRGERVTGHPTFVHASAAIEAARRSFEREEFVEARRAFAEAARALTGLVSEIERAELVERLARLAARRSRLAQTLAELPPERRFRRRRRAVARALDTAAAALVKEDEREAARLLDELESRVQALIDEAATPLDYPPTPIPWRVVGGIAGAVAAIAVVTALLPGRTKPQPPAQPEGHVDTRGEAPPTVAPEAAPTAQLAGLPKSPPVEPTSAAASVPEPPAEPTVAVPSLPATSAEPAAPPTPRPLALASARPAGRAVKMTAGSQARFDAALKGGGDEALEWRLEGEVVGHGRTLLLGKEHTANPGNRELEVLAKRDRQQVALRSWDLQIEPPPLGFAGLEPAGRSVERPSGTPVSFRAPVKSSDGEKLAFVWQVNGQPANGADGPAYDFQPQAPGEYVVQVRATAPWGATIANTWTLSVKPPLPKLHEDVTRSDPRSEAQAWIQAYCSAFEKKDTDTLLALGHLTSQGEAARLRDALSSMNDLKVSCTNPSIRLSGDQAVVSFDRTDRWTDPRGTSMERALPRITKTLRRASGHWVASP